MSLPDGVTTCLLTYGPITDTFGNPADEITVEVVADRSIVHAASGRTMFKNPVKVTAASGGVAQIPVPHTDQSGFRDLQQNTLTGWYYTVSLTARFANGSVQVDTKLFQPVVGQTEVDADLLSSGGMVTPGVTAPTATVTSVNGQTGAVVISGGGGSALTVQDENGNVATNVAQIDFQGAGVTASAGSGEVVVAVPGPPVTSVAGRTGAVSLTKSDVGLANVDNTSDVNKPVSTAQQSAIDAKYTKPGSGIPKTDLTTAVQSSLDKADAAAPQATTFTKTETDGRYPRAQFSTPGAAATGTPSATTFLRGDGTWATPAAGGTSLATTVPGVMPSGNYYPVNQIGINSTTSSVILAGAALGRGGVIPFTFPRAVTPTSFSINVTTAAASSFVRLGIYADNGSGRPGALIFDYGQVDTSTTGVKSYTNTQAFSAGVTYWFLVVVQGAGNGTLQVTHNQGSPGVDVGDPSAATAFTAVRMGFDIQGVTGAMPANLAAQATAGGVNTHVRLVALIP